MTASFGQSHKLIALTQLDNNVLACYTGTDCKIYMYLFNLFTHEIQTSITSSNISTTGLMTVSYLDMVYLLQKGQNDNYLYLTSVTVENDTITVGPNFKLGTSSGLWETESTPTMCLVGNSLYVLYRDASTQNLKLGEYNLLTEETKAIALPEDYPTTTGPGIVPISFPKQAGNEATVRLLLVWTKSTGGPGRDTHSIVLDPADGTFGQMQDVPTNNTGHDLCLRLLAANKAILCTRGNPDAAEAQVVTYLAETGFAGKWSPREHNLPGISNTSTTPTILPYTKLGVAASPASTDATGLLVMYENAASSPTGEIGVKDFKTSSILT